MWSSSQASAKGVVEAGPSHFPKLPTPRSPARSIPFSLKPLRLCMYVGLSTLLNFVANAKG
jgi:hypothetical protein